MPLAIGSWWTGESLLFPSARDCFRKAVVAYVGGLSTWDAGLSRTPSLRPEGFQELTQGLLRLHLLDSRVSFRGIFLPCLCPSPVPLLLNIFLNVVFILRIISRIHYIIICHTPMHPALPPRIFMSVNLISLSHCLWPSLAQCFFPALVYTAVSIARLFLTIVIKKITSNVTLLSCHSPEVCQARFLSSDLWR